MEITDQIIIDKLTVFRHDKVQLNTCRIKETWLKCHELYDYLIKRFETISNIQEIIYRIYYKLPDNLQLHCKTCGKEIPLEFKGFLYGYNNYCSYKCSLNDPNKIHKLTDVKQKENIDDNYVLNLMIKDNRLVSEYCKIKKLKQFGIYDYMMNRYDDLLKSNSVIQEIIYRMKYHIDKSPRCPNCGKYVKFYRFSEGFRHFCSNYCLNIFNTDIKHQARLQISKENWLTRGYKIDYSENNDKLIIYNQCPIHNPFTINKTTFYNRCEKDIVMCPICNPERNMETSIEYKIRLILEKHNIKFEQHVRYIISPRELDFYIPDYKVAIECNGIYWHSGINGKNRFKVKYNLLSKTDILMLTFWEDDIHYNIDKIENIILRSCNLEKKLFSNDTVIKEIDNNITKEFINTNSIKKYIKSDINFGLYKNNVLLFVMTFSSNNNLDYTLNQICYKDNLYIINSEKLLLDYFINNYNANKIIAYCDLEIENKKLYDKLGFKLNSDKLKFNLNYYNYRTTEHRISKKEVNQLLKLDDSDSLEDYMKCYSGYLIYEKENV